MPRGGGTWRVSARPRRAARQHRRGPGAPPGGGGPGGRGGMGGQAQINPGAVSIKVDGTLSPPAGAETLTAAPVKGAISLEAQDMAALTGFLLGPPPAPSGPGQGPRP